MKCPNCGQSDKPIAIIGTKTRHYNPDDTYTDDLAIAYEYDCNVCKNRGPLSSIDFWRTGEKNA